MLGRMLTQLPVPCRCGAVRGTAFDISPSRAIRCVCYCDDCQAFAHYLGGEDLLDALGGSDIVQLLPAQLRITQGAEHLRCMRLSEKGMLRWFTACCRTPVGNTMNSARLPFVGMLAKFVDPSVDSAALASAAGAPVVYAFGKFAVGGVPSHATRGVPLRWMRRLGAMLLRGFMTGAQRPSVLFDERGAPVSQPDVLSPSQRDALRQPSGQAAHPA